MAKVYEAMMLSQEQALSATQQFLNDCNVTEAVPEPPNVWDTTDPLDLDELGIGTDVPVAVQTFPHPVEADVAVAEAIADSVTSLASSLQPETTAMPVAPQLRVSNGTPPLPSSDKTAPSAFVPEAYRAEFQQLGEIVTRAAAQRPLQAILVCGVEPSDHSDFVVENLSLALAENPAVRIARFRMVTTGTTPVAQQTGDTFRVRIQHTPIANLSEIVPLNGPQPIAQILRECDVAQMLALLRQRFDFILLETEAVNYTDDVAVLAGRTDGVILVAQKENMRGQAMTFAREKLSYTGAQILGAVVNRNREPEPLPRVL
jgi:Mrp family chromosome partitioning ATPase